MPLAFAATLVAVPVFAAPPGASEPPPADQAAKPKNEVVERDAKGRATVVRVDGVNYKVCRDDVTDGCINPRSAGLDFGITELEYWPGKPASEIEGPLPATPPAPQPDKPAQDKPDGN